MSRQTCGTLTDNDLSTIQHSLSISVNSSIKDLKDIYNTLETIKKTESNTVYKNWEEISKLSIDVHNDRIGNVKATMKKITECMRA